MADTEEDLRITQSDAEKMIREMRFDFAGPTAIMWIVSLPIAGHCSEALKNLKPKLNHQELDQMQSTILNVELLIPVCMLLSAVVLQLKFHHQFVTHGLRILLIFGAISQPPRSALKCLSVRTHVKLNFLFSESHERR